MSDQPAPSALSASCCLEVESPLPQCQSYADDAIARAFWRESYRVSRRYIKSQDANGQSMLVPHEREDATGFSRRQRVTKPRNFVGPIIRRYNDFVWRRTAERGLSGQAADFAKNVDGSETSIDTFLKNALLVAQVERETYLLCDTKSKDGKVTSSITMSQAQAKAAGMRPVLTRIDADAVPWWMDNSGGTLVECIVLIDSKHARWYGETTYIDLTLSTEAAGQEEGKAGKRIESVGAELKHGYSSNPIERMRPSFDPLGGGPGESQTSPLAESQQGIVQYLSLINEEIYNVTFSQWVAMGVSAEQLKELMANSNRILTIPDPNGKLQAIGADPAQAATIAARIVDETENLYRTAGVNIDASGGSLAESGIAKAFKFNDLAANLAALADSVERSENRVLLLFSQAWKWGAVEPTKYADDFNMPDFEKELKALCDSLVAVELPNVIRKKLVKRFASRNMTLSQDEKDELEHELAEGGDNKDDADGAMPGAPRSAQALATADQAKVKPTVAAANVQQTAMNGAQVDSLVALIESVADGTLTLKTAETAIRIAFPAVPEGDIAALIAALKASPKVKIKPQPTTPANPPAKE
jgi:hypothetical protein